MIYDVATDGHRGRGLRVWSSLLEAEVCSGTAAPVIRRVIRHRGSVVLQTADEYPALSAYIAGRRSLSRRSTICTLHRPAHLALDLRQAMRRHAYAVISSVPRTHLISTAPRLTDGTFPDTSGWIFDPEWWDLGVIPSDKVEVAPSSKVAPRLVQSGLPTIVFAGSLSQIKGFSFFAKLAQPLRDQFRFVALGKPADVTEAELQQFEAHGGFVVRSFFSDEALFAAISAAQLVWCCYRPDYNRSSGIFGRALQLGSIPLVRHGAWLHEASTALGYGVAIHYDDVDGALSAIATVGSAQQSPLISTEEMRKRFSQTILPLYGS